MRTTAETGESEMLTTPGGGCADALCEDCLASILVRLPSASDVLRCRAVCRSWRRVATNLLFLANHAAHRPIQIITISDSREVSATPLSVVDHPRPRRLLFHRTQYGPSVSRSSAVLFSLDGLLVLTQRPGIYVICNPATRQWTRLPVLGPDETRPRRFDAAACGFYWHASSGEHRLLCQVRRNWAHDYNILSAGGGGARRHGRRAPRPANTSRTIRYGAPVSCRGVLHWLDHPEAEYTGMMLAFDTASEAFRLMPLPPEQLAGNNTARTLVELDGELAMAVMQHGVSSMAVWDLRDYGEAAEVWTLRYRVEVPMSSLHFGDITDITGASSRTFLMFTESLVPQAFFLGPPSPRVAHIKFSN
nr:unnamed protein product [Digitaria exilis]